MNAYCNNKMFLKTIFSCTKLTCNENFKFYYCKKVCEGVAIIWNLNKMFTVAGQYSTRKSLINYKNRILKESERCGSNDEKVNKKM